MFIIKNKIIRYVILFAVIYLLLLTALKNTASGCKDSLLISLVVILTFILIDNMQNILLKKEQFVDTNAPALGSNDVIKEEQPMEQLNNLKNVLNEIKDFMSNKSDIKNEDELSYNNETTIDPKTYKSDVRLAKANDKEREGCRWKDGVISSEMKYSDYNHLPIADGYKSNADDYGYSFLPPEKWYPQPPFPPICVTNKPNVVNSLYSDGAPLDAKEWISSLRITGPDNINVDYIREKLNSGR